MSRRRARRRKKRRNKKKQEKLYKTSESTDRTTDRPTNQEIIQRCGNAYIVLGWRLAHLDLTDAHAVWTSCSEECRHLLVGIGITGHSGCAHSIDTVRN
ncbi:unnamed protein product [Ceratitis capitata]|uniref:(Mediterranean fruit fly) hypothetical protein n=1 Tax=Ceratitis capitata TaxID=7213 RepID=A0A811UL76_CERCA|nr:unnamed protein product [Ceratitis capitata]